MWWKLIALQISCDLLTYIFVFPLQYLGSVEVNESRGMHICEEAAKHLRSVSIMLLTTVLTNKRQNGECNVRLFSLCYESWCMVFKVYDINTNGYCYRVTFGQNWMSGSMWKRHVAGKEREKQVRYKTLQLRRQGKKLLKIFLVKTSRVVHFHLNTAFQPVVLITAIC